MFATANNTLLSEITKKVEAGVRISFDEGVFLDEQVDVLTLGRLANVIRERKNGNLAYYNTNVHLNPTNVCVYRCTFCAFRSDLRSPKGYVMSDEQVLARGREAVDAGCTEMHIVGGLHHQSKYDYYLNVIRLLHEHYPSQVSRAWFDDEAFSGLARIRGVQAGVRYAEGFHLTRALLGPPVPSR